MEASVPGKSGPESADLPDERAAELALLRAEKPHLELFEDASLNAQTPVERLHARLTPIRDFFVRNNGLLPAPPEHPERWALTIDGAVDAPITLTLRDLRRRFETVTIEAVLECAGNGRALYAEATDGLPWGRGAVGCAAWTGVRLRDVLMLAGVAGDGVYTGHFSPDTKPDGSGRPALSRGLPIAKALSPETLLAFEMNGEPLPLLHGGPLRVVAPGYPGSAWQKWLSRLCVLRHEHTGEKMTGLDYRLPRTPLAPGAPIDPAAFEVITDMPVRSLITEPAEGFVAGAGALMVRGQAWSGHTPVARVEVSADGGQSWTEALLAPARGRFAWRGFAAEVSVPAGPVSLLARATDEAGRTQPLGSAPWNPKGYCNNAAHEVRGTAVAAGG